MAGKRRLQAVDRVDPIWRLWGQLPPQWRGPVIGEDIDGWSVISEGRGRLDLTGLPDTIAAEMAWMAHWQAQDGTRSSVRGLNHLAAILRQAMHGGHPVPPSVRAMDWPTASALQGWYYTTRWRRLPPRAAGRAQLRTVFGFPRLALLAHCHDGPWWELDEWNPRCDPRIPLPAREPQANHGCAPGQLTVGWLRTAAKWHLGTMLESGVLRWGTLKRALPRLRRFDSWLTTCLDDPCQVLGDPAAAGQHAAAFARWTADPRNRVARETHQRHLLGKPVQPRHINDDLRTVAELFAFVAANPAEARIVLGIGPWQQVTDLHAARWFRQVSRVQDRRALNDENYIDDHALAQITAALPLLGLPSDQQMLITRGDGQQVTAAGLGDPQAMRMILLQILTGRRASEVRTCDLDCIEPVTHTTVNAAEGEPAARFRYAQSKIDTAPDTILVDREVVTIIQEQQGWVRQRFPGLAIRYLFVQRIGNRFGAKPYASGTYAMILRRFSDLVHITDSKGRPVPLSRTHRFRHTKLTRLAELGLPIHVLQRYAGHATPTMFMRYIAQREEHAEQAFLATVKLRADGTRVQFSRDDYDSLHLFDRADRFLPHGWCLLPPLQTCNKGNACLTCSVFVTDATHQSTLERQLADTEQLIARATADFERRHGQPMPQDNVWLAQRHAEHAALTQLLAVMATNPGRAVKGAGCGATATGPVPLTLGTTRTTGNRP